MTVKVVVGRIEGFVSSIGFIAEGVPFVCRGKRMRGLHWETKDEAQTAVRELRYLIAYLRQAGVVVKGDDVLDEVK